MTKKGSKGVKKRPSPGRGRRPKPLALHVVEGTFRRHRHGDLDAVVVADLEIDPPKRLPRKRLRELWDRYIRTAFWLTDHDGPSAYMWVVLQEEFEKNPNMIASRIAQLRGLGAELGLSYRNKAQTRPEGPESDNARFFA